MEGLNHFIHEELYGIREYTLGIVTGEMSDQERKLLKGILTAIQFTTDDVLVSGQVDVRASIWIDFTGYDKAGIEEINSIKVIQSPSLAALNQSVEKKAALWEILKAQFPG